MDEVKKQKIWSFYQTLMKTCHMCPPSQAIPKDSPQKYIYWTRFKEGEMSSGGVTNGIFSLSLSLSLFLSLSLSISRSLSLPSHHLAGRRTSGVFGGKTGEAWKLLLVISIQNTPCTYLPTLVKRSNGRED